VSDRDDLMRTLSGIGARGATWTTLNAEAMPGCIRRLAPDRERPCAATGTAGHGMPRRFRHSMPGTTYLPAPETFGAVGVALACNPEKVTTRASDVQPGVDLGHGVGRQPLRSRVAPVLAPTGRRPESPLPGERHRLLVWLGDGVSSWRLPASGQALVGRADDADIKIDFFAVSRRHARIVMEPGGVRIADLDSQNGTRVNGELLLGQQQLVHGDIINFGGICAVFSADRPRNVRDLKNLMYYLAAHGVPLRTFMQKVRRHGIR
jgi:hypothetical protein